MAQQLGAIRFKGKVANVVGFKNSASSKSNNNFVREHQSVVSNPKTYAQARQRSKAIPAQNFYAAFENVLNHAYLPTDRASRNRNRFISKAMSLDEIPDVLKGESYVPICGYQISEGALGLDNLCQKIMVGNVERFNLNFTGDVESGDIPLYVIASMILENNPSLEEGQELTFLAVLGNENNPKERMVAVSSFVLDKTDTITKFGDVSPLLWLVNYDTNKAMVTSRIDGYDVYSCGLIISSRTAKSWRYTNSFMWTTTAYEQAQSELPTESEVIGSYMDTAANRNSDLILQQADNQQTEGVHPSSVTTMNITLASGVTGTLSANAANIAVMSNGVRKVIVLNGALTTGSAGSRVAITITPTGGTARPLTLADTTFDGNETITVEEVEAYGI